MNSIILKLLHIMFCYGLMYLVIPITSCSSTQAREPEISQIEGQELMELIEKQDVQLVDVRTDEEVSYGVITGAKQVDFYDRDFREKMLQFEKGKPLVVYCAVGGRSAQAATILKNIGFEQIYDLEGGFRSWKSKGYPVEKIR